MDLTPSNSDIKASVVVLQRIVTFFVKSKQQTIREKEGLKPNKNSMAIPQQLRRSKIPKPKYTSTTPLLQGKKRKRFTTGSAYRRKKRQTNHNSY